MHTIRTNAKKAPHGMPSKVIRRMSEEELLDIDYFLNDDEFDDDFGEKSFFIF